MRVISGFVGGYSLKSPQNDRIRPTADRVKENLFNILAFEINDVVFLDLFSGTGAIGIEALSRGASQTVFVDNSPVAIDIIKYNLAHTGLECKSRIISEDYISALDILYRDGYKFDMIFLDPPYQGDFVETAIAKVHERALLAEHGFMIIETMASQNIVAAPYPLYKERKYGLARLIIYRNE